MWDILIHFWTICGGVRSADCLDVHRMLPFAMHAGLLWTTALKLYPVRVRVVNVITDDVRFVTVAYIPVLRRLKEPGADEKARRRRSAVLQRVLHLAFRTAIGASHGGEPAVVGDRTLLAFPSLLLYLADLPEEKAVLRMKSSQCARPCSSCDVHVNLTGLSAALNARDRNVFQMLTAHLEAAGHRKHQREARRRVHLEATTSAQSAVPALAGFAGLSTAPFLLYKMVGYDILHVCPHHSRGRETAERRVGVASKDFACLPRLFGRSLGLRLTYERTFFF